MNASPRCFDYTSPDEILKFPTKLVDWPIAKIRFRKVFFAFTLDEPCTMRELVYDCCSE
jgi:hypothetical protein